MRSTDAPGDRILFFHTWYRGHNNARYAELLPRLERVDRILLTFPRRRLSRAAVTLAWRGSRRWLEPRILRAAERRHRYAFVVDAAQLTHLRRAAVVDLDDPVFDRDAALLAGTNVAAYVVTADAAKRRLEALGVEKPGYVIPQGVGLDHYVELPSASANGVPTAGYLAAFLLLPGDRGGENPLYDVSHLLALWDEVHARVPNARLRLVGAASERLRRRIAGRDDIVVVGRVAQDRVLHEVASFDVALYPRTSGEGVRASKVAEYLGAGAPVVSYDYAVVEDVREAGAGILVSTPREFVAALERLLTDRAERARLGEAARAAGRERDWRQLAARYNAILDRHLPILGASR